MTVEDAVKTDGDRAARGNVVLLLMEECADRRLLAQWLEQWYDVTVAADADSLEAEFDLCLVDEGSFAQHSEALVARKQDATPTFLPYVLVLRHRSESEVGPGIWKHVDEVLSTPIEKAVLRGRLSGLLVRRDLSKTLAVREERIRRMLETIPDPLLVVDERGTVVETNEAFRDYTGESPVPDQTLLDEVAAFPAETTAVLRDLTEREEDRDGPDTWGAHDGAVRDRPTVTYHRTDGTVRSAEVGAAPLISVRGARHTLFVLRDVTERLTHEQTLERERDRLDTFASMLAHEVRNPLNVAQGYLAEVSPSSEEERAALGQVSTSHTRMEQMIRELLAHARGDLVTAIETGNLAEMAAMAWSQTPTAEATLVTTSEAATVEADTESLLTVLQNLFRNSVEHGSTSSRPAADDAVEHSSTSPRSHAREDAVEHSSTSPRSQAHGDAAGPPEGGDALSVIVGSLPGGGFYVEDDGPGIPEDDRERVFERGYTTNDGGTGLGLTLVRQIADAHGWDIAVTEGRVGGARFEFRVSGDGADEGRGGER